MPKEQEKTLISSRPAELQEQTMVSQPTAPCSIAAEASEGTSDHPPKGTEERPAMPMSGKAAPAQPNATHVECASTAVTCGKAGECWPITTHRIRSVPSGRA